MSSATLGDTLDMSGEYSGSNTQFTWSLGVLSGASLDTSMSVNVQKD
jgi:hypothetical protein